MIASYPVPSNLFVGLSVQDLWRNNRSDSGPLQKSWDYFSFFIFLFSCDFWVMFSWFSDWSLRSYPVCGGLIQSWFSSGGFVESLLKNIYNHFVLMVNFFSGIRLFWTPSRVYKFTENQSISGIICSLIRYILLQRQNLQSLVCLGIISYSTNDWGL